MFATFNLQLTPTATLDAAPETPVNLPVLANELVDTELPGFARLMQLQADSGTDAGMPRGEFVPEGGNILPQAEPISTDSEALSAIDITAPLLAETDVELASKLTPTQVTMPLKPEMPAIVPSQSIGPMLPSAPVKGKQGPSIDAQKTTSPIRVDISVPDPTKGVTMPKDLLPAAPVTTHMTSTREVQVPDRIRDRRDTVMPRSEQPAVAREVAVAPRTTVIAETEVVPRVVPMPEATVVPDRTAPTNTPTPAVSTLANAVNQLSGAAPRDPGLVPQATTDLIRTPVTDPAWGDRIGQRVVMMAGNQLQQAEIRLTPAELGPVRVQIAVEDGAANVTFQAQHAATREAIEAAMPRLREMLADSGLSLGQANVGGDGVAEGQRDRHDAANTAADGEADAEVTEDVQPERQKSVTSNGLIDTFV